jgi:gas vesicle protein
MSKRNKALRNILVGVAIGAGVSLLNKENREKISRKGKSVTNKLNQMKEDPELVKGAVRSQLRVVQNSVEKLEGNVQLVKDKWIEIKDSTKNKIESVKGVKSPIVVDTVDEVEEKVEDAVATVENTLETTTEPAEDSVEEQLAASLEGIGELTDENAEEVEEKVESILLTGTTKE